ncbi:hypothetical protein ACVW1C_005726 [Bradyrhizobium sp. USDA 4011]
MARETLTASQVMKARPGDKSATGAVSASTWTRAGAALGSSGFGPL